jgi:hypothetical protein
MYLLFVPIRGVSFHTVNGILHMQIHITRIYLTSSQTEANKATKQFKQTNNNDELTGHFAGWRDVEFPFSPPTNDPVASFRLHFTNFIKVSVKWTIPQQGKM